MGNNSKDKSVDRRAFLATSAFAGAAFGTGFSVPTKARNATDAAPIGSTLELDAADFGLIADSTKDQTSRLQSAVNAAAATKTGVRLRPGTYIINGLSLPDSTRLIGSGARTVLLSSTAKPLMVATGAADLNIFDMALDGTGMAENILRLNLCPGVKLKNLVVRSSKSDAIHLTKCHGSIRECDISTAGACAIHAMQSHGLSITHNQVHDCSNNGIQIWRAEPGDDGSLVTHNRILNIHAKAGGSGQNGNGINVYRADNVQVTNNHISDCAYSAVRANTASNIQMVANTCQRIGEVALYAEFGFQGAMIANNIIDAAATGISVTNFDQGGRLGVVQGNLIRNLFRREFEREDKRGNAISVEADTTVTGNTIEGAPSAGIVIGWGDNMRNVIASTNLIRDARYGILISSTEIGGLCLVTNNMITGAKGGAIRRHEFGKATGDELSDKNSQTGRISLTGNIAG